MGESCREPQRVRLTGNGSRRRAHGWAGKIGSLPMLVAFRDVAGQVVGWVERSETQRDKSVGFRLRLTQPTWLPWNDKGEDLATMLRVRAALQHRHAA
jgi:hypothetical protein